MKAALLTLALFGNQTALVSDRVPQLNVEATCKATAETDKAMGLALAQSVERCMDDETKAQKQLSALWSTNPGSVRDECEGEALAGGIQSYVDLLSCIQMTDWAHGGKSETALRGASKNRNAK